MKMWTSMPTLTATGSGRVSPNSSADLHQGRHPVRFRVRLSRGPRLHLTFFLAPRRIQSGSAQLDHRPSRGGSSAGGRAGRGQAADHCNEFGEPHPRQP